MFWWGIPIHGIYNAKQPPLKQKQKQPSKNKNKQTNKKQPQTGGDNSSSLISTGADFNKARLDDCLASFLSSTPLARAGGGQGVLRNPVGF